MARPVMPSRLHFQSKKLRAELGHFVETHTRFVLEVPSLRGEMVFNIPDTYISPYQTANCLPKGRHSEAAHEKRLLCAQKCTRGGLGHARLGWGGSCRGGVGWVMQGWGGVCHVGVWWVMQGCDGSCREWGWVMQGCSGSHRGGVGVCHALVGWGG